MGMLQLIRQLAKYGPITIEASNRMWHVGCLVRLPAGVKEGFVRYTGDKLSFALSELLKLAKIENDKLWKIQREPKQGKFNYGSTNKEWKEIA
jgi:hypothetical protein